MEISEIKQQLTLAKVLQHYGLKPDKNLRLNCPFHDDKTPSLQVYYKTHTAYCFSANCKTHGKSMDVIDFVMHKENVNKHEALEICKSLLGVVQGNHAPRTLSKAEILTNMFTYFKNAVHNSKPAQEYIKQRGLDNEKLAQTGNAVGYNTGQFHHGARKDETLIQQCLDVGLLQDFSRKSRTGDVAYKPFAKFCLTFALKNRAGQVTGMYFRSTVNEEEAKHYYLKDRAGLYPSYPKPETEKLILTEAIIDASTLLQMPVITNEYSLLSCYGTNGLTDEIQAAILELKHLKEIVFAFDNDEAGGAATAKYAAQFRTLLPEVILSKLNLPEGEDINSINVSHQPEIFVHLLQTRTDVFSFSNEVQLKKEVQQSINKAEKATANSQEPNANILHKQNPYKLRYTTDTANYYIQGGISKVLDNMKITLVIEHLQTNQKSRTKVDLYEDKQVEKTAKEVSEKLNIRKDLVEADLYKLTDLLDEYREQELFNNSNNQEQNEETIYPLTAQERQEIESFLKKPGLIKRLNELLGNAGIVGEHGNRVFLFIIAASYKMHEPLHALIQGSSGSGKTRLLKQISDCIPPEKVTKLTRVSDKVLYNYPEHYFVNRLLCLEDIDGLSEEAEFAFRELQSNGELNSATSLKLENGQITSGQKTVKGPIASMACTTKGEIYEDNMSRVFLIAVDESNEQTKRIIEYQNQRASGNINPEEEQKVKYFIRNLVRELKPYQVVNPYASKIQLPEEAHKIRRLNDLFISFVKMVTILNQYQRKRDIKGRLITEITDIEVAIHIMFESIVLKVDELDGSMRQFYEKLKTYMKKTYNGSHQKAEFSLREVRQSLHISKTQLFRYANDLTQLEYLQQCGGHSNRGYKYKIQYWDNYTALRDKIKQHLQQQIDALKKAAKQPQATT